MIQYNVHYKGFSVGITNKLAEAKEWANTKEHKIYVCRIK